MKIQEKHSYAKNYNTLFPQRKNKVDIVSPVPLFQLQNVVVHTPKLYQNAIEGASKTSTYCSPSFAVNSEQYEKLFLKFPKVSFYLGISPYNLNLVVGRDGMKRVETVASSHLHKVLVVFVHIFTALRCVMLFTLLSYNLKNPLNYFSIAGNILSATLCWIFIFAQWMKHGICKSIVLRLSNVNRFSNVTLFKLRWMENSVIGILLGLLYVTSVYPAILECNNRLEKFCREGELFSRTAYCTSHESDEFFQYGKLAGKCLFILINYVGHTTRRYPRIKLLIISITLWDICKSYGKWIKETSRHKRYQNTRYTASEIRGILESYEDLKEISNLMRKLAGKLLIAEISEDILYFSLEVQLKLREGDWFSIFVVMETWLLAFLAYFIAACAAEPVQEVSTWLARDDVLSQLPPGKVATLHSQLSSNPIGLKGGNLFTVTKSFLANVVTVWLTYFIILLQFQSNLAN